MLLSQWYSSYSEKKPYPENKLFILRVELMPLSTVATFCKLLLYGTLLGNQRESYRCETQEKLCWYWYYTEAKILRMLSRPEE